MTKNWGLIGHEWAVDLFKGQINTGNLRHAYLLSGPQSTGRRTLALALTKAVNCLQSPEPGNFCDQCRACLQINRMQHPDLSIIQREPSDRDIKVKVVRELQHSLALAPYDANFRIALLLNFEDASTSAANALLKTLEEPPAKVIIILTAESPEALLPTIASRCEVLRLRTLAGEKLTAGLQTQYGLAEDQAKMLAHISGGRPGMALQFYGNPEQLKERNSWLEDQQHLLNANRRVRFDYAQRVAKDKQKLKQILQTWLSFWRDVLIRTSGAKSEMVNLDRIAEIDDMAGNATTAEAYGLIASIEHTLHLLNKNVNSRLAIEVLLLEMPFV
ncbi:MAG: DNA polymerase III subunit delta' [Chloroflexi bacterium]|nr:DNA polymerase III subunit delta' [Chloroflexota bacterium]